VVLHLNASHGPAPPYRLPRWLHDAHRQDRLDPDCRITSRSQLRAAISQEAPRSVRHTAFESFDRENGDPRYPETPRLTLRQFTEDDADNPSRTRGRVNAASRRVMEKCGLALVRTISYEGPFEIDGAGHGEVEYALTKPEWQRESK
jgi:hypothetical protein